LVITVEKTAFWKVAKEDVSSRRTWLRHTGVTKPRFISRKLIAFVLTPYLLANSASSSSFSESISGNPKYRFSTWPRHEQSCRKRIRFDLVRIYCLRGNVITQFDWKLFVNMDLVKLVQNNVAHFMGNREPFARLRVGGIYANYVSSFVFKDHAGYVVFIVRVESSLPDILPVSLHPLELPSLHIQRMTNIGRSEQKWRDAPQPRFVA